MKQTVAIALTKSSIDSMKQTVAIIDDCLFDGHIPHSDVPEKPIRTRAIRIALRQAPFAPRVRWLKPLPISRADLEEVHSARYVKDVFDICGRLSTADAMNWISNDHEVLVSQGSLNAVLHAAGAVQQAIRIVLDPNDSVERVFCNVRPPGHHAHVSKGQGFCIFNNVWIGACEARKLGAQRVAIVDWDVHHGNGTQDFILNSPVEKDTLFFSVHQHHHTIWPQTGKDTTKGHYGTVRCGEIRPYEGDEEMKRYFEGVLIPKLREFNPDVILISCGFDGHINDSIAQLHYSSELYGWMTDQLKAVATECCAGRMVSVLEGGYCPPALMESAVYHVKEML